MLSYDRSYFRVIISIIICTVLYIISTYCFDTFLGSIYKQRCIQNFAIMNLVIKRSLYVFLFSLQNF